MVELAESLVEGASLAGLRQAISGRMKEVTHPSDIRHMYADVGASASMSSDQALIIGAIVDGQTSSDPIDPYEIGRRIINACRKSNSDSKPLRELAESLRLSLFPVVSTVESGSESRSGSGEIPRGAMDRNSVITAHAKRISKAYANVQAMVQELVRRTPKTIAAQDALLALGEALGIATVAPQAGSSAYVGAGQDGAGRVNIGQGAEVTRGGGEPFDLAHEADLARHADEVRRGEVRSERPNTGKPQGEESLFSAIMGRASTFDQLLTDHASIEVDGKLLAELNFQELVEAVAVGGPVEKSSSIAAQHIRAIISEIKGDFVHMSGLQASADFIGGPGMSQDEFTAKREEARAVAEVKADGAFDEIAAGDVLVTIESAVTTTKEKRSRNRG